MAPRPQGARLAKSFKGFGARFSFVFFIILAIATLIASRFEPRLVDRAQSVLTDATAPILTVLNYPVRIASDIVSWSENLISMHRENTRLRAENEALKTWEAAGERLLLENERLRALLDLKEAKAQPVAAARVIGQSNGNYTRNVVINAGRNKGLKRDNTVVDSSGLIGRVTSVGALSSRVLLLTDLNSRVPVKVLPSEVNAILAGDNSDTPTLLFLPGGVTFNVGDWVVTTGHGGVFPPDIAIGRIAGLPEGMAPKVMLTTDYSRIDNVRVFNYDPPPAPPPAQRLDNDDLGASDTAAEAASVAAGTASPSTGSSGRSTSSADPNAAPASQATAPSPQSQVAPAVDQAEEDEANEVPAPPEQVTTPAPNGGFE